jgi:hypothetical protein
VRAALMALAILCSVVPLGAQLNADRAGGWLMIDFRAYYCAALAQREGHNPYYADSLHACQAQTPRPYYRPPSGVTVPAPYPPYALALFAPLTFVPFGVAAFAWWTILALSLVFGAWAISRLSASPLLVGWAVVVLSLGLVAWSSGNVVPVGVAAVVVAALFAARGRFVLAAIAIAVGMIEPQIALPAALALAIGCSAARIPLLAAFAVLAVLSLATAGFAQSLAYVTAVLPAHALSEVSRDNQYSVSTVLAALGVSDTSAVLAGSLSYAVMVAVGIPVAIALARRYADPAMIVLVPPAMALLGGSFVHTGEIAVAAPAALLLFTRATAHRAWLLCALILLAVPWLLATSAAMFLAPIFPAGYLAYALWHRDRTVALAVTAASLALILGLFALAMHPAPAVAHSHAYAPIDPRLAEASWQRLVLGNTTNRPVMWLLRLPTWAGLIAFAAAAIALSRRPALACDRSDRRLLESGA